MLKMFVVVQVNSVNVEEYSFVTNSTMELYIPLMLNF